MNAPAIPHVEIFVAPGCNRCGRSVELVASLHRELGSGSFAWRRVDVVAELDRAVALGVRATPSIAIDGRLVFTTQPSREKLRVAILQANDE